jgi:hypothetical protein
MIQVQLCKFVFAPTWLPLEVTTMNIAGHGAGIVGYVERTKVTP